MSKAQTKLGPMGCGEKPGLLPQGQWGAIAGSEWERDRVCALVTSFWPPPRGALRRRLGEEKPGPREEGKQEKADLRDRRQDGADLADLVAERLRTRRHPG